MYVLSVLGLDRITAPVCDTEDLHALLVDVLPTFSDIAERTRNELPDSDGSTTEALQFYTRFNADVFNLLSGDEVRTGVTKHLTNILNELEIRFVTQKDEKARSAFRRLGFERREADIYPKLRALVRTLPEDGARGEDFLTNVHHITRITRTKSKHQRELLRILAEALVFFYGLLDYITEPDSPCPLRFSNYPPRNMYQFTEKLFNMVQVNWCCQCPNSAPHASRKTRLNLTEHQRFATAPDRGEDSPRNEARFRILFPTSSLDYYWQDTEITVHNRDFEKTIHEQVNNDLCGRIQMAKLGARPRMLVYQKRLWQLHADVELAPSSPARVQDGDFRSLKDLLQPSQGGRESLLSSTATEKRLVLSFVLTTSLLCIFGGPWLPENLSSENICFLVPSCRSLPDITEPYLTTTCSSLAQRPLPVGPSQLHHIPEILSLGILLLEIAQGFPIVFKESHDRCYVALEHFEAWAKRRRSQDAHEGLGRAILACISPKELRKNGLDKTSVDQAILLPTEPKDPSMYIFGSVLYPLEEALKAYEIQSNTLHTYIARKPQVRGIGSFDHQDDDQREREEAAKQWLEHLEGVYSLVDECDERCNGLKQADKNATRVKIAVLDTGLQLPGALQENYEEEGRVNLQQSETFVPVTEGETTHDWRVVCDGHGSRVGEILLRIAPTADLHVAKVFETRGDLADPEMATQVHERIAKASFQDAPLFHAHLTAETPPLFFAATGNDGAHKAMAWPAKDMSVIGVSSTAADGGASPFNPLEEKEHYPILYAFGEGVPVGVAAPDDPGRRITKYVSGTSYATPVAAALAANLLGCIRMLVVASREDRILYGHVPGSLRQMRGMLAVLRRHMQKKHVSGLKSLLPWDFLKAKLLNNNRILQDVDRTLQEV
ncbi:putative subtilase [Colletotrichum sublineola]|uniref:Putative subtilase n=1 Tax=Colletotrichum sublineola TaxID=1173701 RepID=A0A066X4Y5_COLSU|nr:putative subtilase [Colletotrichum sublineola]